YKDLEFDVEINEFGALLGTIPPMVKKKKTDSESPGPGAILGLMALVAVLPIACRLRDRL
ncbi:MAG: hypothetical protein KAS77_12755, partial [Thermoplasmata archaeon]|nr:hypothetical protein [Thermoplasmata archaeon]